MSLSSIKLPLNYIEEFRKCINENDHLILNNDPYRKSWNIICACMDRIEDTARYLNSKKLGQYDYGCAFDLMEFLIHSAIMLNCIDTITEVLKAENKIATPDIIFKGKNVTNRAALDEKLKKVKPYKNEDDLYFEYIRSIGIAHPNGTDRHVYFQQYNKETSPFLVWNRLSGLTDGDIVLHIYDLNGKENIFSLKLQLPEIFDYVLDRYSRIAILNEVLNSHIEALVKKLKAQKILSKDDFGSYKEFSLYLKGEAHKRYEYAEYYIEDALKIIDLKNMPEEISSGYSKYCNALAYAMDDLREILQAPIFGKDFNEEILLQELHLPSLLREDESNMTGYYYEKTGKLYNSDMYGATDIDWAKTQAKKLYKIVKKYAPVEDGILDRLDDFQLLAVLNTALYFYSLEHDTFINKKIPKTSTFR